MQNGVKSAPQGALRDKPSRRGARKLLFCLKMEFRFPEFSGPFSSTAFSKPDETAQPPLSL
jgi:hypothetical protein